MNHKFLKLLALSSLTLALSACSSEEDNNNDNNDNGKCTANVCKDDGTALLECNVETGETTETPCPNGCDLVNNSCRTNSDNNDANKCTADVCKNDNTLLSCDTATGATTEIPCANGCDQTTNACKKCTADVCSEDGTQLFDCNPETGVVTPTTCSAGCNSAENACFECTTDEHCASKGKICENNKCIEPQCTANVCGEDQKTLKSCTNRGLWGEEKTCDVQCLDGDCRDAGWCSSNEHCTEEGKNYCNLASHTCTDFACSLKTCEANTTCVLGICVPNDDLNVEKNIDCNKDSFVSHCRGNELWYCNYISDNPVTYKVSSMACSKGCFVYNGDSELTAECAFTTTDYCSGAGIVSECEEDEDWFTGAWVTKYICTKSTNDEQITIRIDKSCGENSTCNYSGDDCN